MQNGKSPTQSAHLTIRMFLSSTAARRWCCVTTEIQIRAMAERGGRDFPVTKKKVSFKSVATKQASFKMKDTTPMEEDELVQIDSSDSESEGFVNGGKINSSKESGKALKETMKSGKASLDSPKTGSKTTLDSPATKGGNGGKGDWGKAGNVYSSGKAGGTGFPRSSAVNPPVTEVELKLEMELPKNARVVMDCEAEAILQGIHESLSVLSNDSSIKIPDSFNKALQYCKASKKYTRVDSARLVLDTLKEHGVIEGEICMMGNICPETIDEVYALIPSLRANMHKNEEHIRGVVFKLAGFLRS